MKHIHLIGIGGSGLSAIALLLKERGYVVSGSDRDLSPLAEELIRKGMDVKIGHAAANVCGADLVIRSSAIPLDNPEIQAALDAGIPVLKRSEFLSQLVQDSHCIAVAGTHGKTTTTAMLAWILTGLQKDPSFVIGGVSKNLGTNAHAGKGNDFIIEADEYDRMFLGLYPDIAVITNLEHDHPDCYPTGQDYLAAFRDFANQIKDLGTLIINKEDPNTNTLIASLTKHINIFSYGLLPDANYAAEHINLNSQGGLSFSFSFKKDEQAPVELGSVHLQVPGEHNVRNALAALAVVHQMGLDLSQATNLLSKFSGTGRRFDLLGTAHGIAVINDYAHHPTEIQATLSAARSRYPNQEIWAVWQPHTFSRTFTLIDRFTAAFLNADHVIVSEVYAAREKNDGLSAKAVVEKMVHPDVRFIANLAEISRYLIDSLQPGDVLLVLSAGDADKISTEVFNSLAGKEQNHGK